MMTTITAAISRPRDRTLVDVFQIAEAFGPAVTDAVTAKMTFCALDCVRFEVAGLLPKTLQEHRRQLYDEGSTTIVLDALFVGQDERAVAGGLRIALERDPMLAISRVSVSSHQ
jgi:hypothetical protein